MSVVENTVEIARAPEDVFDYLSDMRNPASARGICGPDRGMIRRIGRDPARW